jgi:Rieske Fe-S protein
MAQYLRDWPGSSEARSLAEVRTGEARIVEVEREKVAAFRDEAGHLHAVSAVCTHMKCIVRWNAAERTWDCPCHGSRFGVDGALLEGPAMSDLPPAPGQA